jgi:hypothetical protein
MERLRKGWHPGLAKDLSEAVWNEARLERAREIFLASQDPKTRSALLFAMSRRSGRSGALDFLLWLYPEYGAEIADFYPSLKHESFNSDDSPFGDPATTRAWAENLRAVRERSKDGYKSLADMRFSRFPTLRFGVPALANAVHPLPDNAGLRLPYPLGGASYEGLRPPARLEWIGANLRAPESGGDAKARYSLFDRVIEANFQVLQFLSSLAGKMTRSTAAQALSQTGRMARLFAAMFPPKSAPAAKAKMSLEALKGMILPGLKGLPEGDPLPEKTNSMIFALESCNPGLSLHSLVNWMHQKALAAMGSESSQNLSGCFQLGETDLDFTYLGDAPVLEAVRGNPLLKSLLGRLDGIVTIGDDSFLFSENRLWLHAALGCHSAEIFADASDPDEGGMLRVRYKESSDDGHELRIRVISSFLERLGIPSVIEGNGEFLTATWDKDHGLPSRQALAEAYPLVVEMLHDLVNMDLNLDSLRGNVGRDRAEAAASRLGEIYAAEGGWPFDVDSAFSIWSGLEVYEGGQKERRELSSRLSTELARLGLKPLPEGMLLGQRSLDRHFTRPIEEAAALGLVEFDGISAPSPAEASPLDDLIRSALEDPAGALSVADALAPLETVPIGKAGALRAEAGVQRLGDGSILAVRLLRDPASGRAAFAEAFLWDRGSRKKLNALELKQALAANGMESEAQEPLNEVQQGRLMDLLSARPARTAALAEAKGLPASPGAASGPISFDKALRREGAILAVPYTTPDDLEAISRSAGVLATGGGSLSHAAITTRELGLPSIILHGAHWEKGSLAAPLASAGGIREAAGAVQVSALEAVADARLREGDLVRIDGLTGELLLLERAGDGPLHRAHEALEALRSGKIQRLPDMSPEAEAFAREEASSNPRYAGLLRSEAPEAPPEKAAARTAGRPLWARLEKRIERADPRNSFLVRMLNLLGPDKVLPGEAMDRLMALLKRMMIREGPDSSKAYLRLSKLYSKHLQERVREIVKRRPSLLPLDEIDDGLKAFVGGKSAKLGEMAHALPGDKAFVPGGVALTIYAYERFLEENSLKERISSLASRLDASGEEEVPRLSAEIRKTLLSGKLHADLGLGREILEALPEGERFAVRSSAIQEDLDDAAFAGAAESYLHVPPGEVLDKVVENWASFWLPRGILYRRSHGLKSAELQPATLIQTMSPADASGVIFTRNPVDGSDEIVINAAWGLGEGVVSGQASADVYAARKTDGLETQIPLVARKLWQVVPAGEGSGTRLAAVPKALRGRRALSQDQTRDLARVARSLEKQFGRPMDVEYSIFEGRIVILQARPITSLRIKAIIGGTPKKD